MKVWVCIHYEDEADFDADFSMKTEVIDKIVDSEEKAKEWQKQHPTDSDYREYDVE